MKSQKKQPSKKGYSEQSTSNLVNQHKRMAMGRPIEGAKKGRK